jgi:hypothetical protein
MKADKHSSPWHANASDAAKFFAEAKVNVYSRHPPKPPKPHTLMPALYNVFRLDVKPLFFVFLNCPQALIP